MRDQLRPALTILLLLTIITGAIYPLAITAIAQIAFPYQANGSLIKVNDQTIGSELIGQTFNTPNYFWGRPSATAPYPYNAAASSGSNLGPLNPLLLDQLQNRSGAHQTDRAIPVDLITASASGLDPARVRQLVDQFIEERTFGVLGELRVNVLKLNLALDDLAK